MAGLATTSIGYLVIDGVVQLMASKVVAGKRKSDSLVLECRQPVTLLTLAQNTTGAVVVTNVR